MTKKRLTPQEKKAFAYEKDRRGKFSDSPNVKFARKIVPLRNDQETRRRRRVFNARARQLTEMDEAEADIVAGELEQDLGHLGRRIGDASMTLREHVEGRQEAREARRIDNALWVTETCPSCGRTHRTYLGGDPEARAAAAAQTPDGSGTP